MAFNALVVNKLRTFLSLLGITIGILSIIAVFTVVDAMERSVRDSVQSLGDNVIYIQKWPWTFGPDYPWWKYFRRPVPSPKEMEIVRKRSKTASAVCFMASKNCRVEYLNNSLSGVSMIAVSPGYDKIKDFELAQGRYVTLFEFEGAKNVGIIGHTLAEGLFGAENAVGKTVKVKGRKIKVIGVFDKEGDSMFGTSLDEQILIPIEFGRNFMDIRKERFNPFIMAEAKEGISNQQLTDELRGIMRSVRRLSPKADDNFALNEVSLLSSQLDSLFGIINVAGWWIGGFSVLVGGFGIANIMFVSVKERTSIIGIQKALGAKNYFILFQFLFESVILCLIGGSFGLFIVFIGGIIVGNALDMELLLTLKNIIKGLGISVFIGLVAGIIPAAIAALMNPVDAIRST